MNAKEIHTLLQAKTFVLRSKICGIFSDDDQPRVRAKASNAS